MKPSKRQQRLKRQREAPYTGTDFQFITERQYRFFMQAVGRTPKQIEKAVQRVKAGQSRYRFLEAV